MRNNKLQKERPLRFGYEGLYNRLIEVITTRARFVINSISVYLLGFIIIFFIVLKPFNPLMPSSQLELIRLIRFYSYTISYVFVSAVIVSIFQVLRSVFSSYEQKLPLILCLILIKYPNPYTQKSGQSYKAITQLREVASVEQARADWRSSTFSILSWATLLGLAFWFWQIAQNPEQLLAIFSLRLESLSPILEQTLIVIGFILLIPIALTFIPWVLLINFLTLYYSTESANRFVLISCIEAQSLLEQLALNEKIQINLVEKKRIAKFLGCEIIVDDKPNLSLFEFAEDFLHENKKYWVVKRRPIRNDVSIFAMFASKLKRLSSDLSSRIVKRFRLS